MSEFIFSNLSLEERKQLTEKQIRNYFDESMKVMLTKNSQRGDCWRNSGLIAQFIEIHSMYFRLRNLIWDQPIPAPDSPDYKVFEDQVHNALTDMRNFSILAELCLIEKNIKGDDYVSDKLS